MNTSHRNIGTYVKNTGTCVKRHMCQVTDYSTAGDSRRLETTQLPVDPGLGKQTMQDPGCGKPATVSRRMRKLHMH